MSAVWGWSKVECTPDGGAPCQRSLHAAAVLNDSIYIFGGEKSVIFIYYLFAKFVLRHPLTSHLDFLPPLEQVAGAAVRRRHAMREHVCLALLARLR